MPSYKNRQKLFFNQDRVEKKILERARKNKQIIYGARSIQAQIGIFSRPTQDYDIFTKNPKGNANSIQKELDKAVGFDYYYSKKGLNPGTYKVKSKGYDMKKGTEDDESVVDYTLLPNPRPPVKRIGGLLYRSLAQERSAKNRALRDKKFAFRHAKDREDVNRINLAKGPF